SMALMVVAGLGLMPWDVLHQGVSERSGWTMGSVTIVTGAVVLLCWLPLRQRPGFGTVANVVVIGLALDAFLLVLRLLPELALGWRIAMLATGVVLNGVATAAYIGARMGPGPRDGLMTGLVARTGRSVRLIRTLIELSVLATGWLRGGTVGVGTIASALSIGPILPGLLPRLAVPAPAP